MDYDSLKYLCSLAKIPIPQGIEILEDCWSAKKYARLGALKRFQLYGELATPEGRRKGGLATQRLIKKNPALASQSGIVVRKKIYDPGYSSSLAEFVGIMLGDGGITNYQIHITLNSDTDKEYSIYVKNILEKLFYIESTVFSRKKELAIRIVASGRNLVELLQKYGLKVGNKVKQSIGIPTWILGKNEFAIACLRGLMDTDGSFYSYTHRVNGKIYENYALDFTNRSQPLLDGVRCILTKLGYAPTFRMYKVILNKKKDLKRYFREVGSSNPIRVKKFISSKI